MGLNGIDISSWREDLAVARMTGCDFAIVKATGGKGYRNDCFKRHADETLAAGKLLGCYHYARDRGYEGTAEQEADWFVSAFKPYIGKAIPFLDWEADALALGGGKIGHFTGSETGGIDGAPGDQTGRESRIQDWYRGSWDGVLCYNGKADTGGVTTTPAASASATELANCVIAGDFGNGDARKAALGSRYEEVQAGVNRILSGGSSSGSSVSYDVDALARRVIAGEFGNGDARKAALGDKYGAVQKRVNEILAGTGATKTSVDVDAMARAVTRGDYGNGEERKCRLGSYYSIVQARVNEMLP